LPANAGDAGSMVAQAMSVFDTVRNNREVTAATSPWNKPEGK